MFGLCAGQFNIADKIESLFLGIVIFTPFYPAKLTLFPLESPFDELKKQYFLKVFDAMNTEGIRPPPEAEYDSREELMPAA